MNFEKIIEENSTEFIEFANEFHYYRKEDIEKMMKQACIQVLDEAAERAEARVFMPSHGHLHDTKNARVDKQSILKIKEEL